MEFYKEVLQALDWIVQTVKEGYVFPFTKEVHPTVILENNCSSNSDPKFVWVELCRLEGLGCIARVGGRPRVILPLSMVFSKKMRLVMDASRGLNPYILKRDVTLEGLDTFAEILREGDYIAINDLKSGYWQVPLQPNMFQYCGVHYQDPVSGELVFWTWRVLFLGIKDAVYIFTHLLRPVIQYMRKVGWRGSIYIDDLDTLAPTFVQCQYWWFWAMDVMAQCGWFFSEAKRTELSQSPVFLGVAEDTLEGMFHMPQHKLDDIIGQMEYLLVLRRPKARGLASVIGKLVAAYRTFGKNLVRLMTRGSYRVISFISYNWEYHVWLTEEAQRELSWWLDNIRELNRRGRSVQPSPSLSRVNHYLAGDASGCGLCLMQSSVVIRTLISESLMPEESNTSSTLREILVFYKFYCRPQTAQYRDQTLIHFTDNQTAASILVKGSRKVALHDMAVKVHLACQENVIILHPVWKRRS